MKTTQEILETNQKQKEFYNDIKQNFFTQQWAKIRNGVLNRIRKNIGIQSQVYDLHRIWFGDLANKKVLDLGCFRGNYWSLYLAENAKSYTGIDLSDVAIGQLQERIQSFPNAKAVAIDFLSDEFEERDFDLIYAYGVLHHFENIDILISKLKEKMAPGATIISYDPLETSIPIKILRSLYRPFQTDAEWEWPFTKKTFRKFQSAFAIVEKHGLLGKSKWIAVLSVLPMSKKKLEETGKKWHQDDWERSAVSEKAMFRCMHLTMLMKNK